MSEFESERFASVDELLSMLRERSDDFTEIRIQVPKDILLRGPRGETKVAADCCGSIHLCSGKSLLIHRQDLEILVNDGLLQRLRIPVRLTPP